MQCAIISMTMPGRGTILSLHPTYSTAKAHTPVDKDGCVDSEIRYWLVENMSKVGDSVVLDGTTYHHRTRGDE